MVVDPGEERYGDDEDAKPLDTCNTLANGTFVLRAPVPGRFEVTIERAYSNWDDWAPGRAVQKSVVAMDPGVSLGRWRVHDRPRVQIALRGPDGKPFSGKVECWVWSLGKWLKSAVSHLERLTVAHGMVSVSGPGDKDLQAGVSLVEIRSVDYGVAEVKINSWTKPAGEARLQPGGEIQGQGLDQSGKPMPRADVDGYRVVAAGASQIPTGVETKAGPDGRFALRNLPPGDYIVDASLPGGRWDGFWLAHVDAGNHRIVRLAPGEHDDVSAWYFSADTAAPWMTVADRVGVKPSSEVSVPVFVDGGTGRGTAPGAYIGLFTNDSWDTPADVARTGADGHSVLRAPGPGSYEVRFLDEAPPDLVPGSQVDVTVKRHGSPALVRMHYTPNAHFRPVDSRGNPMQFLNDDDIQAWIWAVGPDGQASAWETRAWYSSDGAITVSLAGGDIAPDQVRTALVDVRMLGAGIGSVRMDGWKGQVQDIVMSAGVDLSATLVDADGKPVASTKLKWRRVPDPSVPGGIKGSDSVKTGVDGSVKLPHMFAEAVVLTRSWWDEAVQPGMMGHETWLLRPGVEPGGQTVRPGDRVIPWLWAVADGDRPLPGSKIVRRVNPGALAGWPSRAAPWTETARRWVEHWSSSCRPTRTRLTIGFRWTPKQPRTMERLSCAPPGQAPTRSRLRQPISGSPATP